MKIITNTEAMMLPQEQQDRVVQCPKCYTIYLQDQQILLKQCQKCNYKFVNQNLQQINVQLYDMVEILSKALQYVLPGGKGITVAYGNSNYMIYNKDNQINIQVTTEYEDGQFLEEQ